MFSKINWSNDNLTLNDLVFRFQIGKNDSWKGDSNHFIFYKDQKLINQYDIFFKSLGTNFNFDNVIEIGMWDGGSAVFWNEILKPKKMVGIDILETGGGDYFKKYRSNSLKTYWGVDQSNAAKLREIYSSEFKGQELDLVFDDASHIYYPTLVSFETLFPHLKPGGVYIIEDWAWSHWKGFENNFPPNTEPTKLIYELVAAAANVGLIESLSVFSGFVAIKRSEKKFDQNKDTFKLESIIYNRPVPLLNRIKNAIKLVLNK